MKNNALKVYMISLLMITFLASCNLHQVKKESSDTKQLSNTTTKASSVYLTLDNNDVPVISWIEYMEDDLPLMYYAKWDDKLDNFGKYKSIPIPDNTSTHEEGMPKIVFKSDGTLMVIYESSTPVPGKKWGVTDLRYIKTIDDGKNWTASESVIQNRNIEASQSFSGISRLGDGEIGVAWLDTYQDSTTKSRPVKFARTEKGKGFGKSILLDEKACECCRVAVTGDAKGNIAVAYRDLADESIRDISIVHSKDNGKTFNAPQDFTDEQWMVEGCPHNGPSLAKHGENTFATWFSGAANKGVKFAKMDNYGKVLFKEKVSTDGRFSQLITTKSGIPVITYCEDYRVGDSIYSRINIAKFTNGKLTQQEISPKNSKAFYPVIRQLDEENVIIAWKDQNRIFVKRVNLDF